MQDGLTSRDGQQIEGISEMLELTNEIAVDRVLARTAGGIGEAC